MDDDVWNCTDGEPHDWEGEPKIFYVGCVSCIETDGTLHPKPDCHACKGDPKWRKELGSAPTCSRCGIDSTSHSMKTEMQADLLL